MAANGSGGQLQQYLFSYAAKGLQSYIMRTGLLRDMVGATSLIEKLSAPDEIDLRLLALGLGREEYQIVQAAAGSARLLLFGDGVANRVAAHWPIICHAVAPGLELVQHLEPLTKGYVAAAAQSSLELERARSAPAIRLPEAGPFVRRAGRTGYPSVAEENGEWIDLPTLRKRAERNSGRRALSNIADAFGFQTDSQIPNDFEQISGGNSYLAIIHADGNGVGKMFIDVLDALRSGDCDDQRAIEFISSLSKSVVDGTRAAVRHAVSELSFDKNVMPWPIAPIVLAGDDVTLVTRADLALTFSEAFLTHFSAVMSSLLDKLRERTHATAPNVAAAIPAAISTGVGVVFCSDHYPFAAGYSLCESLASFAKQQAKLRVTNGPVPPPSIAFHKVTGAFSPETVDELASGIWRGASGVRLTACPYFVGSVEEPRFANLVSAARPARYTGHDAEKRGLPSSALRGLLNLLRTSDVGSVIDAVKRMKEVAHSSPGSAQERAWEEFESAWKRLAPRHQADANWMDLELETNASSTARTTPFADLLTVADMGRKPVSA